MAGRWGLTVSQERCQAAAQWPWVLPRGPGLPPRTVGRVLGDGPRAWAGRTGQGVSAAASAEPAGAGPLGGHRGPSAGSGVKVWAAFVPSECPWPCRAEVALRLCPEEQIG